MQTALGKLHKELNLIVMGKMLGLVIGAWAFGAWQGNMWLFVVAPKLNYHQEEICLN